MKQQEQTTEISPFLIIIRPEFMRFCKDACRAASFSHLLFRIAYKCKDQPKEKIQAGEVLWYGNNDQITWEMSNAWGLCKVRKEINELISANLIGKRSNPTWGVDRTKHFFFGKEQCEMFIRLCEENNICIVHLDLPPEVKHLIYSANANDKSIKCSCPNPEANDKNIECIQSIYQMQMIDSSLAFDKSIEAITKNSTKITTKKENKEDTYGDDADAHRDPHPPVEISTTDTTLTIVFDDEHYPDFSQVAQLPNVSTWLNQTNLSTPDVENSGEGVPHEPDTTIHDHPKLLHSSDGIHCGISHSDIQKPSGNTHRATPDQAGIADSQQSQSASIASGHKPGVETILSQQSHQENELALPEKSQQPSLSKTSEINRLTKPVTSPCQESVEHSSLPSGIERERALREGESLPVRDVDKTSIKIHDDTQRSNRSYSQKVAIDEQAAPASSSLFPVSESDASTEASSLSVGTLLDMAQAIEPSDPPEMPPAEMLWGAEKLVRITEAKRIVRGKVGKRFSTKVTGTEKKSQRQNQIAAAKKILAQGITQEQYLQAYVDRNDAWWNDEQGSLTVVDMANNTSHKRMRILEILEKLETRSQKNGAQQNGRVISLPDRQAQQNEEEKQRRERNRLRTADELRDVDPWGPYSKKVHGGAR